MKRKEPLKLQDDDQIPDPYDGTGQDQAWFLPDEDDPSPVSDSLTLPVARRGGLIVAEAWRAAEASLAPDLAELTFDLGRLDERAATLGPGARQRLALAEAASVSWWTGDRVSGDALALWLSYRIGAAGEGGDGLIRTAWAARRLMTPTGAVDLVGRLAEALGGKGRADAGLIHDVVAELDGLKAVTAATRGCALFHLWRSLEERPDHLRGLEAAVLGARVAAGRGRGVPILPLSLTGFTALTATGAPDRRLAGWIGGAHRAVLSALMALERLAAWRARAAAETEGLQGRIPARLIAALAAHPMLGAAQAEAETGASRAAVQRNLDVLAARGLVREVTGQGRFRVWATKL